MHPIMTTLHQDHINLSQLLTILEQQSQRLTSEQTSPDLFLMADIVDYIHNYPDLIHHPKEDIIYAALAKKTDEAQMVLDTLLDQHQTMPATTTALQNMLRNVANGEQVIAKDSLQHQLTEFIKAQRSHMDSEETQLFPLINRTFTSEDWAVLESQVSSSKDPLFGDKILDHYQRLYQSIDQQADSRLAS